MFRKVLVAIDQSDFGREVFRQALDLASAAHGELLLVHVLSTDEETAPRMPLSPILDYYPVLDDKPLRVFLEEWSEYEKEGRSLLDQYLAEAQEAGVAVESRQPTGSAGKQLCEVAREWGADLIVTGRRGRSGLSELVLGSVSNYVMHHAPCAVLVVPRTIGVDTAAPQTR